MDRERLAVAATLSWLASRAAPASMRSVFDAYNKMLVGMSGELRIGRTYGVAIVPWSLDESGAIDADRLRDHCGVAAAEKRKEIEATQ